MFMPGDYIMYSNYGVCIVDEIKDKIIDNEDKKIYILHPFNDNRSRIMTPTDNNRVKIRSIMTPEEAEEVFHAISNNNIISISNRKLREQAFIKIIKEGNPIELVWIINTLIIEESEKIAEGKKISATDRKYLEKAEKLLYLELSVSLNLEIDQIKDRFTNRLIEKI